MPTHTPAEIIATLRAHGIPAEPHQLGLAEYTNDPVAYAKALKACQPTSLRVLTMEGDHGINQTTPPCAGTLTCDCPTCARERLQLVKRGGVGNGPAAFRVKTRRAA